MADLKNKLRKIWEIRLEVWQFIFIYLPMNLGFIYAFFRAEVAKSMIPDQYLVAAFLSTNLLLFVLYFRGGRKVLSGIPWIALGTALLTIVSAIHLAQPEFPLLSLEASYRISQLFVGESAWIDSELKDLGSHRAARTIAY